ncbi:MAG: serine/threonine protein kinase, partial [Planctomycetes bacterium]|nr:serine/threonine protein kinase [Planctomycetota bacterium]
DVLDDGNICALVMEYVEGPALDEWIYDDSVEKSIPVVLGMFRGIALGVAAAHRAGLVHRDLKPDNVLLAPSNAGLIPKITDFGLVKVLAGSGTQSGVLMGTPEYMSPEQVRDSASVDARTDLWALGVLLYEMLSGEVPFAADEVHETYVQIVNDDFLPLRELRPDVPAQIEDAVNRLLSKKPDDRFQTAEELLEALFPDGRLVSHNPQLATAQLL